MTRIMSEEAFRTVIHPTVRAQWRSVFVFVLSMLLWGYLFSYSLAGGGQAETGSSFLMDTLSRFSLFALLCGLIFLGKAAYTIYNSSFILTETGVEARSGNLGLTLYAPSVRYEDIRLVEPVQGLIERILNVGDVEIASAMTGGAEIIMHGVANPSAVAEFIESQIDRQRVVFQEGGSEEDNDEDVG